MISVFPGIVTIALLGLHLQAFAEFATRDEALQVSSWHCSVIEQPVLPVTSFPTTCP